MLVKNLKTKLLAIALIFTLTFANFAVVTKTYASGIFSKIFATAGTTGSKDVEFDAYFKVEDEKLESLEADVNDENLKLYFDLNLLDEGYIKNSKISIVQSDEVKELNFKVSDGFENELVEFFEDNQIGLVRIEEESTNVFEVPIEYVNEEFINLEKLSGDFKVIFEGVYVDEKAKEKELSKEIILNLSWKDKKEPKVESEVTKFFQYESEEENYSILQTLVKIDTTGEGNVLPVKNIETKIELPQLGNGEIVGIGVVATSTMATNNKANEEVEFGEENIGFDEENDILTIKTENKLQTVVEETEDILKEEIETEEEKYFSGTGVDEYLVTYKIKDLEVGEGLDLTSKITAKVITYAGIGDGESKTEIEGEIEAVYTLSEQTGENVSYKIENETEKLTKGYMYFNYNDSDKKYELEYKTKSVLNISTPELIEELKIEDIENYYLGKDESKTEEENVYYKKISVSKENFDTILGKNGKIEILDIEGNVLGTIQNIIEEDEIEETKTVEDTTVADTTKEEVQETTGNEKSEETEEYFEVNFEEKYSKLILKISAPVEEGNLVINEIKAQTETALDKKQYSEVASISQTKKVTAKYVEVEEIVDIAEVTSKIELEDTTTKANLVLSTDKFSTLVENKDVEIKIELNNQKLTSDIYGNSVFEIEFPEYVRNLEITDSSIMYGEGLEISNIELLEANGKIYARVSLTGLQNKLSSGLLTNGTNIVLNANIIVDEFAPAKQDEIKLYYNNEESTNYISELVENLQGNLSAVEVKQIEYSAPTGVVSVNSISNYNEENTVLTSINQGIKSDTLEILTSSKNAKMELIVMNNSGEAISNIAILGRIPFKGVKDVITGEDLNTTVDSKLLTAISSDERNETGFKVYYSENGGATAEVELEENGWIENPENLDNIKSYLIVPEDAEYKMENNKIVRFSYEYLIPENLEHNTDICSAFATYYINANEVEEISGADIVYLTTGKGPQLRIETTTDTDKIKQFEELAITSKVKNIAPVDAKNVVITMPLPEGVKFVKSKGDYISRIENNNVIFEIGKIEAGKEIEVSVLVLIEEVKSELEIYSIVSAKDLAKTIESEKVKVKVLQAEMKIELKSDDTVDIFSENSLVILPENMLIKLNMEIKNLTDRDLKDIVAEMNLNKYFEFQNATTLEMEGKAIVEEEVDCYNSEKNSIEWKIENLECNTEKTLNIFIKIKELDEELIKEKIYTKVSVKAEGTEEYISPEKMIIVGKPVLEIKQTTDTLDTYVIEGNPINYNFEVKNVGVMIASKVNLTNKIPEGLTVKNIEYTVNNLKNNISVSNKKEAVIKANIGPGETMFVNITAIADNIGQAEELSVTNYATAKGINTNEVTSNSITHIIEPRTVYDEHGNIVSGNTSSDNNNNNVIEKTYKITGVAWLDENEDGVRASGEIRLSGITAKLVDPATGIIKDRTTTNTNGEYTFKNVGNGNYIVIFDYDSSLYSITKYQASNAATNVNSDVTSTTVSQDGKQVIAAVTNTITVNNVSVSNIDIGLVPADSFDLQLEKTVTKITVQNAKGTDSIKFDNTKLAKTEIASKYINSSIAYIEYSIKVSNTGDLAGYAKKIVDYMPEETIFNSGLKGNEAWYTGTDGELYSAALADTLIAPGETKEIKLVLTKQMNEHSSSLMSNTAEIYETYNVYGAKDVNSTAGNKVQNENDMSTADTIIGVKTGEVFVYTSVIITTLLLCGIVIFFVSNKVVLIRRKGGA